MHNTLIQHHLQLPQDKQTTSCFKPINAAGAKQFDFIQRNLNENLKKTAAFLALERSWIEFINNADDAHAKSITTTVIELNNSIIITIHDDGDGLPTEKESAQYDWKKALLSTSDKVAEAKITGKKSCGQHLALATTTYALEREHGTLSICNNLKKRGAIITITSPLTFCDHDLFLEPQPGKGNNIIDEMFYSILEQDKGQIKTIQAIAKQPTGSRAASARRIITSQNTPINTNNLNESDRAASSPLLSFQNPPSFRRTPSNLSASFTSMFQNPDAKTNQARSTSTREEEVASPF